MRASTGRIRSPAGLTLFVKGTLVGGDRKMHVIGGAQEETAGYLMEPAPVAELPI